MQQSNFNQKRINARIQKWRIMMKEGVHKDQDLLRSRIRKGIPQAIRALAWPQIVRLRQFERGKRGNYNYQKLINTPSKSTHQITLDIPRTFPEQQDSKILRRSLNNVLKALSIVYKKMGYCQGMNFLALRILQVLDDEQTFWLLHYLLEIDPSLMKNFIQPKGIEEQTGVFSELMQRQTPKIKHKLEQVNIPIHVLTVRWFMTLFSSTLQQQLFYRVFEIYLNQGWSVIYKVGLMLLKNSERKLLQQRLDNLVLIIQTQINEIKDIDQFIQSVCQMELTNQQIGSIRAHVVNRLGPQKNNTSTDKNSLGEHMRRGASYQFPELKHEPQEQLQFQRRAEQVTFEVFNLMNSHN